MSSPPLKKELETYEAHKPELLAHSAGKYVVIYGSEIKGTWDTYEDALQAGYSAAGLNPFLVKRILDPEPVYHFQRDIDACRF